MDQPKDTTPSDVDEDLDATERTCVGCGCTDSRACDGGCSWVGVDPPLCSTCAAKGRAGDRLDVFIAEAEAAARDGHADPGDTLVLIGALRALR